MLRVPVTPEEWELIEQKMVLLHTRNFSAYARKMLIDGYIVNMDPTDIQVQTAEIQKIGANVNQIAKRLNSMGPVCAQDIEDIKGGAGADMAVTKIHPIKSTLKKALDYIRGGGY